MEENYLVEKFNSKTKMHKIQIVLDTIVIILLSLASFYIYLNWDWLHLIATDSCAACMNQTGASCIYITP